VSDNFLKAFLSSVELPYPVAKTVVLTYASRYASDLAYNRSLGSLASPLVTSGIEADALAALISLGDLEVLDAVLASPEHRIQPLSAILNAFISPGEGGATLSVTDQLRFTKRALPPTIAEEVLRMPFVKDAQSQAAAHAGVVAHAKWVLHAALSDEELFPHLENLAKKGANAFDTLVPLLQAHPDLRSKAVVSEVTRLFAAACWTELNEHDQIVAFETASASGDWLAPDPVVGLLAQPALLPKIRDQLWSRLSSKQLVTAYQAGVRRLGSASHFGVPIRDLDEQQATILMDLAAPIPVGVEAQAASGSILVELSRNPSLSRGQWEWLAQALCQHAEVTNLDGSHADYDALIRVAGRLDPKAQPVRVLRLFGLNPTVIRALTDPSKIPYVTAEPEQSIPRYSRSPLPAPYDKTSNESVDDILEMSIAGFFGVATGRLRAASSVFTERLGDGTTERSLLSWTRFLALVGDDQMVPLKTVIDTAIHLAIAESTESAR
jgi:hypothetical protein